MAAAVVENSVGSGSGSEVRPADTGRLTPHFQTVLFFRTRFWQHACPCLGKTDRPLSNLTVERKHRGILHGEEA